MPLRYRRTCLRAWRWKAVGACINWDNLLTTKETSGWVIARYCKEPTMRSYAVASIVEEPLIREILRTHRSSNILCTSHVKSSKQVSNMMMLRKKESRRSRDNFNTQKLMQRTQILDRKLSSKLVNKVIKKDKVIFCENKVIDVNKKIEFDVILITNK